MTWTAVVLAGSRPGRDALAERFGTDLKALIPIAGEPMVRRPVAALLESKSIENILVLSQSPERIASALPPQSRVRVERSGGTIAGTLLDLISDDRLEWPVLVTTADHALLDPAIVDQFCNAALNCDVGIGVVERANLVRRLPQARRTWLKFRGGAYTGANLFALRSNAVAPAINLWASAEQDRKKGRRLISLLGPGMMLATALRCVSLDQALAHIGARLGLSMRAIRLSNPLAGVDVDKADDHALAEAILEGRA